MPIVTRYPYHLEFLSTHNDFIQLTTRWGALRIVIGADLDRTTQHDEVVYLAPAVPVPTAYHAREAVRQVSLDNCIISK